MTDTSPLEFTITHNFADRNARGASRKLDDALTRTLFKRKWIGIRWHPTRGPAPSSLTAAASAEERLALWATYPRTVDRTQVEYFFKMAKEGAAVIGAFKGALRNKTRSHRLVGTVRRGQPLIVEPTPNESEYQDLLCLPLTDALVYDSSRSFLGNLAPFGCTIQPCSNRALGRLWALASGDNSLDDSVFGLHNKDVEWLVHNFLLKTGLCGFVYQGGQSMEGIDHRGFSATETAGPLVAQTTVSKSADVIREKLKKLQTHPEGRRLLFAPSEFAQVVATANKTLDFPVEHISIEEVFQWARSAPGGSAFLDALLGNGLHPIA